MAACILMLVVSCTHLPGDLSYFPAGEDHKFGRYEEDIDALETRGLHKVMIEPLSSKGDLFSERGILGGPVQAQSGERLEIHWEGFFPKYRLYYFPSPEHHGVVIGECRFADGCNSAFFLAPDSDGNGVPDRFQLVQWTTSDYGGDDGIPGYLDRYRHIYDVSKDRYYLWHDILLYRCTPPVSSRLDPCKTNCDPPYETRSVNGRAYPRVFRARLVEERPLLGQKGQ